MVLTKVHVKKGRDVCLKGLKKHLFQVLLNCILKVSFVLLHLAM